MSQWNTRQREEAICCPVLRREWGIRSPWWGRSHTGGCSKDPSRLREGGVGGGEARGGSDEGSAVTGEATNKVRLIKIFCE